MFQIARHAIECPNHSEIGHPYWDFLGPHRQRCDDAKRLDSMQFTGAPVRTITSAPNLPGIKLIVGAFQLIVRFSSGFHFSLTRPLQEPEYSVHGNLISRPFVTHSTSRDLAFREWPGKNIPGLQEHQAVVLSARAHRMRHFKGNQQPTVLRYLGCSHGEQVCLLTTSSE